MRPMVAVGKMLLAFLRYISSGVFFLFYCGKANRCHQAFGNDEKAEDDVYLFSAPASGVKRHYSRCLMR